MVERLNDGETVRVVNGNGTDVEFSIDGMRAVNDYGQVNMPGGEVYTAPVVDSLDGTVTFDLPLFLDGRILKNVRLDFEDGRIAEYDADRNRDLLGELLALDDGSDRVGEFGIGMNEDLDRLTRNMAFDEKMHGTVHFALGSAYKECVGESNERNDSAVHLDMLVDMREDARIEIDGEVVQRDGEFVFD